MHISSALCAFFFSFDEYHLECNRLSARSFLVTLPFPLLEPSDLSDCPSFVAREPATIRRQQTERITVTPSPPEPAGESVSRLLPPAWERTGRRCCRLGTFRYPPRKRHFTGRGAIRSQCQRRFSNLSIVTDLRGGERGREGRRCAKSQRGFHPPTESVLEHVFVRHKGVLSPVGCVTFCEAGDRGETAITVLQEEWRDYVERILRKWKDEAIPGTIFSIVRIA